MKFLPRHFCALLALCLLVPTAVIAKPKDPEPTPAPGPKPAPAPTPTPTPTPAPAPAAGPSVVSICSLHDLQGAVACSGYYAGNLNGGSAGMIADQKFGLAALGFTWDGVTIVQKLDFPSNSPKIVDFSAPLIGTSFLSIHYGRGNGPADVPGGGTGFYKIAGGVAGLDKLVTMFGSLSNAVLYSTGIQDSGGGDGGGDGTGGGVAPAPEPASWVTMIIGFGLVGATLRRERTAAGKA